MRALVRGEVRVAAPARVAWDYVTDWQRQGEWIPFTRVEVLTPGNRARVVGGRFRAWTGIGPLGFWDPITVTVWEERPDGSARCEIMHTGRVVRGDAELRVVPDGPDACTVSLWEHLDVPGGPVGALLWRLVGRFVGRGADLVLGRLARRVEPARGGAGGG
jgi:hypothetical protein